MKETKVYSSTDLAEICFTHFKRKRIFDIILYNNCNLYYFCKKTLEQICTYEFYKSTIMML